MEGIDLQLEQARDEIMARKAKKVLIQLPDGLKPRAKEIVDFLRKNTKASFYIFQGTCFGACDTPVGIDEKRFDLLVQFGHSQYF